MSFQNEVRAAKPQFREVTEREKIEKMAGQLATDVKELILVNARCWNRREPFQVNFCAYPRSLTPEMTASRTLASGRTLLTHNYWSDIEVCLTPAARALKTALESRLVRDDIQVRWILAQLHNKSSDDYGENFIERHQFFIYSEPHYSRIFRGNGELPVLRKQRPHQHTSRYTYLQNNIEVANVEIFHCLEFVYQEK